MVSILSLMRVTEDLLSNEDTGLWEKHALGVFVVGTIIAVRTTLWSLLRRGASRSRHSRVHEVHARVVSWRIHGLVHVHPRGFSGGIHGLVRVHAWLGSGRIHGLVHAHVLLDRRISDWVHVCRHDDKMADDGNVVKMAMWYGWIDGRR